MVWSDATKRIAAMKNMALENPLYKLIFEPYETKKELEAVFLTICGEWNAMINPVVLDCRTRFTGKKLITGVGEISEAKIQFGLRS